VDIVTQADKRSEQAIVARLNNISRTTPSPLKRVPAKKPPPNFAGTSIHSNGTPTRPRLPVLLRSIALAQRDTLLAAVVFNPVHTNSSPPPAAKAPPSTAENRRLQSRHTFHQPALHRLPTRNRKASPNLQYYGDFTQRSHGVRRDGSAALDLASVAAGRFDGFWDLVYRSGTPPLASFSSKKPVAESAILPAILINWRPHHSRHQRPHPRRDARRRPRNFPTPSNASSPLTRKKFVDLSLRINPILTPDLQFSYVPNASIPRHEPAPAPKTHF